MKFRKIQSILVITLLLASCANKNNAPKFDYGKVEKDIYFNDFFNLQMNLPSKWEISSQSDIKAVQEQGKKILSTNNSNFEKQITEVEAACILNITKYKIGSLVDFNPTLTIQTSNLKRYPQILNGKDMLIEIKKTLDQSQIKYSDIDENFAKTLIGGREFYQMNTIMNSGKIRIEQSVFSTIINDWSFIIVISYSNKDDQSVLLDAIKSMTFQKN